MNKIMQMRMEMRDEVKKVIANKADAIDDLITDRYMKDPNSYVNIKVTDISDALGVSKYSVQNNIDLIQTVIIEKFGYIVVPFVDDDFDIIISLGIRF